MTIATSVARCVLSVVPQRSGVGRYAELKIRLTLNASAGKVLELDDGSAITKTGQEPPTEAVAVLRWLIETTNSGQGFVGFSGKVLRITAESPLSEAVEALNQGLQIGTALGFGLAVERE